MLFKHIVSSVFVSTFLSLIFPVLAAAQVDTLDRAKKMAEDAKVRSIHENFNVTIQNVNISKFPEVNLIVEAVSKDGRALDSINPKELTVIENGSPKRVLSIRKISVEQRIPVDFVFIVDVTGTMQPLINAIRANIEHFIQNLVGKGIDYNIGLITFTDYIERTYQPTADVKQFAQWLAPLRASGGLDEKENALEALAATNFMKFRPAANRIAVLITDAPYHQVGERGNGRTKYSTQSIIKFLKENQTRVFCIAPAKLPEYQKISEETRGAAFDISQPFAKILDLYSTQLTNLYSITYRSDERVVPDSINVAIVDDKKQQLVRQIIPIVSIGRKFIIENLLFAPSRAELPDSVSELETLAEFMKSKPTVNINIEGHTDSQGSVPLNKELSKKRAESVKNYLVRKGIEPKRMTTTGYGPSRPIADNSTEFGRSLNRRTEIVIVAK
ncbi:MAG TPA: OmpA family protein [Patescibacteria group bacterium]|nr:OmpA family protein [Patescibacteria group bacterium]